MKYLQAQCSRADLFYLDEHSAHDLMLAELEQRIAKPQSSAGQEVLHFWLYTQTATAAALQGRRGLIDFWLNQAILLPAIRKILGRVGRSDTAAVVDLLWSSSTFAFAKYRFVFKWLLPVEALILILCVCIGGAALFGGLVLALLNLFLFLASTRQIESQAAAIFYLAKLLSALPALGKKLAESNYPDWELLHSLLPVVKSLPVRLLVFKNNNGLAGDLQGLLMYYIKIFMLGELSAYFKFLVYFNRYRPELQLAYGLIGRLDASVRLAELVSSQSLCRAELTSREVLSFEKLTNPLLEKCVPVSCTSVKHYIITGSNMAGKTTFLHTVGINQAFALSCGFAWAITFHTDHWPVFTAINLSDDLLQGKSRYMVQAERLLSMIRQADLQPGLLLVDEILSGTNSSERIRAAINILKYLAGTASLVVATSHDLEIAEALDDYDPAHFCERISENDLHFDYHLKPGIVDRQNACRILRHLGFGKFISELG